MRPSTARDRLHAAVVAIALFSTSVSIVVAGQPQDGVGGPDTRVEANTSRGESAAAMRSFTDMIAEAAREQERLSAATPSEECVSVVDASASARADAGAQATHDIAGSGQATADVCGETQAAAAL